MKRILTVLAFTGALTLTAGVASASVPSADHVIHACLQPQNGNITRVIDVDAGQTCANNETPLDWNQTGPQGAKGDTGPAGPQGSAGAAGISGYQIISETKNTVYDANLGGSQPTVFNLTCPEGKVVMSGGYNGVANPDLTYGSPRVIENYPTSDTTWRIVFEPVGYNPAVRPLSAYTVCVTS